MEYLLSIMISLLSNHIHYFLIVLSTLLFANGKRSAVSSSLANNPPSAPKNEQNFILSFMHAQGSKRNRQRRAMRHAGWLV